MAKILENRKALGRTLAPFFAISLIFGTIWYLRNPSSRPIAEIQADSFAFALPGGQHQTLAQYRGKVVLLNFWAHWCDPCVMEMPSLRRLEEHFEGRPFVLLAVHASESNAEIERAFRRPDFPRNLIYGVSPEDLARFSVSGIPVTFLIDPQGKVQRMYEGARNWMAPSLLQEINHLLGAS